MNMILRDQTDKVMNLTDVIRENNLAPDDKEKIVFSCLIAATQKGATEHQMRPLIKDI